MKQPLISESFNAIAADLSPLLLKYLGRYVGDSKLAEDLRQETLIRIKNGLPEFKQHSSLKTWAFTIASRVATDHFRKPENRLNIIDIDAIDDIPDSMPQIEDRLMISEMSDCVRIVIDSLPPDYREALILHDLEGMNADQVAGICRCSIATAKIRIHRARTRLKDKLENKCNFQRDSDGVFRCERKP